MTELDRENLDRERGRERGNGKEGGEERRERDEGREVRTDRFECLHSLFQFLCVQQT